MPEPSPILLTEFLLVTIAAWFLPLESYPARFSESVSIYNVNFRLSSESSTGIDIIFGVNINLQPYSISLKAHSQNSSSFIKIARMLPDWIPSH